MKNWRSDFEVSRADFLEGRAYTPAIVVAHSGHPYQKLDYNAQTHGEYMTATGARLYFREISVPWLETGYRYRQARDIQSYTRVRWNEVLYRSNRLLEWECVDKICMWETVKNIDSL